VDLKEGRKEKTHPAQWVGLEDFLKAHGLRSMGLWAVRVKFKKTHPAQWVGLED